MALSKEITSEIETLFLQGKHNDIVKQKLASGDIAPQDVYDYVQTSRCSTKSGKPYTVDVDAINELGVAVSELPDSNKKCLAA